MHCAHTVLFVRSSFLSFFCPNPFYRIDCMNVPRKWTDVARIFGFILLLSNPSSWLSHYRHHSQTWSRNSLAIEVFCRFGTHYIFFTRYLTHLSCWFRSVFSIRSGYSARFTHFGSEQRSLLLKAPKKKKFGIFHSRRFELLILFRWEPSERLSLQLLALFVCAI